jgi:hypothetical protein
MVMQLPTYIGIIASGALCLLALLYMFLICLGAVYALALHIRYRQSPVNKRVASTKSNPKLNREWLSSAYNKEHYKGKWVLLFDGQLIDSDVDRVNMHKRNRARSNLSSMIMVRMPGG